MSNPRIGAHIIDINRIYSAVNELQNIDKDKAIKAGLKQGAFVFLAGGKRRLRDRMKSGKNGVTGNLVSSFRVRVKRTKLGALAGFNSTQGFGKNGGKGYHAHLVDRGTTLRANKKNANRGIMPGNFFWTDTIANDDSKALDKVYKGVERAVLRIQNRR